MLVFSMVSRDMQNRLNWKRIVSN